MSKHTTNQPPVVLALGLALADAAKATGANEATLRGAIRDGELLAFRVGRNRLRVPIDELLRWLWARPVHRPGEAQAHDHE